MELRLGDVVGTVHRSDVVVAVIESVIIVMILMLVDRFSFSFEQDVSKVMKRTVSS